MIVRTLNIFFLISLFFVASANANEEIVEFQGAAVMQIVTSGESSSLKAIPSNKILESSVKIVRSGDKYFWRSRGDLPMAKIEAGAFITYMAVNGAGYVRIINPSVKENLCAAGKQVFDCKFSYVEHLTTMLSSVTYYGK